MIRISRSPLALAVVLVGLGLALSACSEGSIEAPVAPRPTEPVELPVLGLGAVEDRFTSELWVHGGWAYTGTWGRRGPEQLAGNVLHVWDVRGETPRLAGSVVVGDSVSTLGDVQVSDDGSLLVVATEHRPHGSIRIFDLADPSLPREVGRFEGPSVASGVHTAEVARVGGTLYAFLSVPGGSRLVIVDLSDPARPREVLARAMGEPYIHDVFVRDGLLFTALWNGGVAIWDLGGEGRGSPADPVLISQIRTVNGNAHNVWWGGRGSPAVSSRYLFVGEEGPMQVGTSSSGDVHVVDISDLQAPREVAFFTVPGAGTHNFSVDEERGILYAAYYNAGVRALDATGDLGQCAEGMRVGGRCDLRAAGREIGAALGDREVYVWGVHRVGPHLYASDFLNGLWKIDPSPLHR